MEQTAPRGALFGRWLWTTALAHAAGALAWALPASWLVRGPGELAGPAATVVMFGLTVVAALAQGAVLGAAQGRVLRDVLGVRPLAWTGATALGVAFGWGVVIVSAARIGAGDRALSELLGALCLVGLAFGASVGFAQWTVLRDRIGGLGWVLVNALGWGVALVGTVGLLATSGDGWAEILAIGATAALLAGAAIGAATGALLLRVAR